MVVRDGPTLTAARGSGTIDRPMDLDELAARGLYDPSAPDAPARRQLLELLVSRGASVDEMLASDAEGRLPALLGDRLIRPGPPEHTLAEVAERLGTEPAALAVLWRAAGFPDPDPSGPQFSDADVVALELMTAVAAEMGDDGARQLARVIGSALARVAEAAFVASLVHAPDAFVPRAESLAAAAITAERLGLMVRAAAPLFDVVFRRHVEAAARRWDANPTLDPETVDCAIGFADLSGSTALSQGLGSVELVRALSELEGTASEIAIAHGGRVIKLIGDEVMFVAPDLAAGCGVALDLVAAVEAHPVPPTCGPGSRSAGSRPTRATCSERP